MPIDNERKIVELSSSRAPIFFLCSGLQICRDRPCRSVYFLSLIYRASDNLLKEIYHSGPVSDIADVTLGRRQTILHSAIN